MILLLTRTERPPDGTFGLLAPVDLGPSPVTLHTLEDDWLDNAPRVSCIPAGSYTLQRSWYHKGGYETFEITGVPNRSRILIHKGNTEEDLEGCVAVGMRQGRLKVSKDEDTGAIDVVKRAVVQSAEAFRVYMDWLKDVDAATLTVAWSTGLP